MVIGVDLLTIHPLPGATLMGGQDFTLPKTQQLILDVLQGRKVMYISQQVQLCIIYLSNIDMLLYIIFGYVDKEGVWE